MSSSTPDNNDNIGNNAQENGDGDDDERKRMFQEAEIRYTKACEAANVAQIKLDDAQLAFARASRNLKLAQRAKSDALQQLNHLDAAAAAAAEADTKEGDGSNDKKRNAPPPPATPQRAATAVAATSGSSAVTPSPPRRKKMKQLRLTSDNDTDVPDWFEDMRIFLTEVPHGRSNKTCSKANAYTVMRQIRKLTSGAGVNYARWPNGVVFAQNRKICIYVEDGTEETDLHALRREAKQYEDKHGEDKGHGWLPRHPITKLMLFKEYLHQKQGQPKIDQFLETGN